jgi:hypothetical protein
MLWDSDEAVPVQQASDWTKMLHEVLHQELKACYHHLAVQNDSS